MASLGLRTLRSGNVLFLFSNAANDATMHGDVKCESDFFSSRILLTCAAPVFSQKTVPPEIQLLTRTSRRQETRRFSYGGTVTLIAAPRGSVTVEGWSRNEVEVTADIELKGPTEADLDQLAGVNSFVFDEDLNHISVLTTGTHDRAT